jgi:hypothetical protein
VRALSNKVVVGGRRGRKSGSDAVTRSAVRDAGPLTGKAGTYSPHLLPPVLVITSLDPPVREPPGPGEGDETPSWATTVKTAPTPVSAAPTTVKMTLTGVTAAATVVEMMMTGVAVAASRTTFSKKVCP